MHASHALIILVLNLLFKVTRSKQKEGKKVSL